MTATEDARGDTRSPNRNSLFTVRSPPPLTWPWLSYCIYILSLGGISVWKVHRTTSGCLKKRSFKREWNWLRTSSRARMVLLCKEVQCVLVIFMCESLLAPKIVTLEHCIYCCLLSNSHCFLVSLSVLAQTFVSFCNKLLHTLGCERLCYLLLELWGLKAFVLSVRCFSGLRWPSDW